MDLDEADMARAKAQTKVGLLTALESSSSRAEQIARQIMIFGRVLTRKEMIEKIDALGLEDVRATGARLLRTAPTVAILGATRKAPGAGIFPPDSRGFDAPVENRKILC